MQGLDGFCRAKGWVAINKSALEGVFIKVINTKKPLDSALSLEDVRRTSSVFWSDL